MFKSDDTVIVIGTENKDGTVVPVRVRRDDYHEEMAKANPKPFDLPRVDADE